MILLCGKGVQRPALSNVRLGFHVRGDWISANRLFDTIQSGTVPMFTRKAQYYSAQQRFIDWEPLSLFIPMGVDEEESWTDRKKNLKCVGKS